MNSIPASPNFADSASIQRTVQKEMRRRKLLVGIFLLLLLVPVAAASLILFASRARPARPPETALERLPPDLERQGKTNQTLAEQQRQIQQLSEKVGSIAQAQTERPQPVPNRSPSPDTAAGFSSLRAAQSQTQQQVVAVQQQLAEMRASMDRMTASQMSGSQDNAQLASLQRQVTDLKSGMAALAQNLQQLQQQTSRLEKQVQALGEKNKSPYSSNGSARKPWDSP